MSLLTPSLIDEFDDSRASGIGGSDIAAILGLSRYRTPLQVYEEKVGLAPKRELNKHMMRGIQLEPIAASVFADEMQCTMALPPVTGIRHTRYKHVIGHPDRIIHTSTFGRRGILEIKCPDRFNFIKIRESGKPTEEHEIQCQYYMGLCSLDLGYVMYFNADLWEWEIFEIKEDLDQQLKMFDAAEEFWMNHVDCRKPPKETELPAVGTAKVTGTLEGELLGYAAAYAELQSQIENANAEAQELRAKLIGTAATPGTWKGAGYQLTFNMMPGKKTLSKSKMLEAGIDPEPYMTEGKPYPVVSVKHLRTEL